MQSGTEVLCYQKTHGGRRRQKWRVGCKKQVAFKNREKVEKALNGHLKLAWNIKGL